MSRPWWHICTISDIAISGILSPAHRFTRAIPKLPLRAICIAAEAKFAGRGPAPPRSNAERQKVSQRAEEHEDVDGRRKILDVIQVVFQPPQRIMHRVATEGMDLWPAGPARFHNVALNVVRHGLVQTVREFRPVGL